MLQPGTLIENKYEVIKQIGKGGMSVVYLAIDRKLNKYWTIKEIIKSGKSKNDKVILDSLIAEANLIKALDHAAIPRIVEIINRVDTVFIVRDYIEGEPMNKILKDFGSQPQASVLEWMLQLCDVLDYLHNRSPKIIYRDMKPANIMLVSDGSLRLIDFGIAKEIKSSSDYSGECTGTKGFAPPEQFRKDRNTDERSDIYSLGMTVYQLATGVSPAGAMFDRETPIHEINNNYSAAFSEIISKCIQENPEDRFQNCSELRYALHQLSKHNNDNKKSNTDIFSDKLVKAAIIVLCALCAAGLTLDLYDAFKSASSNLFFGSGALTAISAVLTVVLCELRVSKLKKNIDKVNVLQGKNKNYIMPEVATGSFFDQLYISDTATDDSDGDAKHALKELMRYYNGSEDDRDLSEDDSGMSDVQNNGNDIVYREDAESSFDLRNALKEIVAEHIDSKSDDSSTIVEKNEDDATQLMDEDDSDELTVLSDNDEDDATQLMDEDDSDELTVLSDDDEDDATQLMDEDDSDELTVLSDNDEDDATQLMDDDDSDELTVLSDDDEDDATQLMDEDDSDELTVLSEDIYISDSKPAFELLIDETVIHTDEIVKL